MTKRILGLVMAVTCVALLCSCASLRPGMPSSITDDSQRKADVQMGHIADAVRSHDAAALKKLFSPRAREKAADLDRGLSYFLATFPSGKITWKSVVTDSSDYTKLSRKTEELFSLYKISAGGKEYSLFFADFTVNDADDPKNVGLYALGAAPYVANAHSTSGTNNPFYVWTSSFDFDSGVTSGNPGVYVPQN